VSLAGAFLGCPGDFYCCRVWGPLNGLPNQGMNLPYVSLKIRPLTDTAASGREISLGLMQQNLHS
jgi:hypothetical protein